jgi:hypothetical protein
MPHAFTHISEYISRQARLVLRHLRHGRASLGLAASSRKTEELTALFRVVNAYLEDCGAEHALAYGTLLGWHRSQGLLPHDRDVDFSAPESAYPKILAGRAKLPRGFALHDTSHEHGGPKLYVSYRGWEADIYFLHEENGLLRHHLFSDLPGDSKPFPRDYFFPLRPVSFLGEKTYVPAQALALLTHHYGYIGPDAVLDPVTKYYRPRHG